jgi:hypothetical protein
MKLLSCVLCVLLTAASAGAQEVSRAKPEHEYATVFVEPKPVTLVLDFVGRYLGDGNGEEKTGFYPALGRIVTGAGWVSVGAGYRHRVLGNRAMADGSAAVSWRAYKQAQGRFEFPDLARNRLALGTQLVWQDLTQLNYFGLGPASAADAHSEYRLKTTDVIGYATYRPMDWLSLGASAGHLDGATLSAPTGPFDGEVPDARALFPTDPALGLDRQPAFAHGRLFVVADTRDYPDHPTTGGLYQLAWSRFADLDLDAFSFDRYEVEAAHFVPLLKNGVVFALHGWGVMSGTAESQNVPVYLMPALGGSNTLRAYSNFRFHDRNLLLTTAEVRVALTTHIDTAIFADAGSVASQVKGLRMANSSYGLGFRVHTHKRTTIRVDAAHGREGWRVRFSTSDPFRFRRVERQTAVVPFVP